MLNFFVDTDLPKVQFLSVFSAVIYSAYKVVKNLQKTNTFGVGNIYFKKQNAWENGSNQMLLCKNVLLPWHSATWFS